MSTSIESADVESPYLTSPEVQRYLRISKPTLQKYVDNGLIKYSVLPGGDRRYLLDDVKAVLSPPDENEERRRRMQTAVAANRGELGMATEV